MRMFKGVAAFVVSVMLAACGGGGGNPGNTPFGGNSNGGDTTTSKATTVEVLASSNSVGSGGDEVGITAIVKDASNASLPATAVSFSASSGTLSQVTATTDASGVATAKFSSGSDKSNRDATITVTSGNATGSVSITIRGTKLTYSGATTFALNATPTLTIAATDSNSKPIANVPVTVSSALANGLSTSTATTDANGQASITYTATNSGTDTVQFAGAGASATASLTISGEDFSFISPAPAAQVVVSTPQTLQVRYRQGGAPQVGRTVTFAATIGTVSPTSAVTDASGVATTQVSSNFAGSSIVTASLQGAAAQATLPVSFVATTPSTIVLQVSPTAIGPNSAGSTANQATATARVVDASGNPVTGVTVNFSQTADPSGGTLQQASATTDLNGQAVVKYIAGATSTASGGVKLRAQVASNTAIQSDASLTVNQAALFIALGTGNVIENINPQTYKKDWTVYVTDANGVAVSGVTITTRVLPVKYYKGRLAYNGTNWTAIEYGGVESTTSKLPIGSYLTCDNEDADYDGVLDAGEDFNTSGTLEPGNVISVSPGTVTTDSTGRATLSLAYAESYVPWVRVRLQVQAIVAGTASSTSSTFDVSGAADDFTDEQTPPAGVISPYGEKASCQAAD